MQSYYCIAMTEMLQCTPMAVSSAKFLKRQAAACATLAAQTSDEESRQRCLRLEQTYLQLAQGEEQVVVPPNGAAAAQH